MEINYEMIAKANANIQPMTMARQNKKTGEVVTKAYAEVNQRIKAFRMVYPDGCIDTSEFYLEGEMGKRVARCRAYIRDREGCLLGTGFAEEKENSSQINMTSFIENCETSAVGRALGMCGFGIDTSLASYEEVANAINQQENAGKKKEEKVSEEKVDEIRSQMFKEEPKLKKAEIEWLIKKNNLVSESDITDEMIAVLRRLQEEKRNANK